MSQTKKGASKKSAKAVKKSKVVTPKKAEGLPAEALVYDPVLHERLVVEYRNESRWWFGVRMFKVYHPSFAETPDNSRWVLKLGRILGPFNPENIPSTKDEEAMIRFLMEE